jgi:GT2 family glycosyltransferase
MDLSIIIVNWNSTDYLRRCIGSIVTHAHGIEYEIIVVDSASFDGCGEMLRQHFPEVRFIQSERNIGFARSNNLGANRAQGRVLLFLNPDTEMYAPAIATLYRQFRSLPNAGVAGCRLLNSDGSLQTSCVQRLPTVLNQILDVGVLQQWFPRVGLLMTAATFGNETKPVEVEAVSGACLMIERAVFRQVGDFSTDYFMYGEDLDLCYKAKQVGYRNYYVPGAVITHHGGGSSRQARSAFSDVMIRESVSRFLGKSRGQWYRKCYRVALTATSGARLLMLALLYPTYLMRGRSREWSTAKQKWTAILRWGLGRETWTQKYNRDDMAAVSASGGKGNPCAGSVEN